MKSGWVTKKLGEVCDSFNGIWKGAKPPFKTVGVIRATNFTKQCEFDSSRTVFIDVEEKKFKKRKLEFGDIIVERSGGGPGQPVGRVIFFNLQEGNYTISNFTSALRVKDKDFLDPYYLYRALVAKYFSGVTEKMQSNSIHIINLNYSAYLEIEIPIPPLTEQRRIVAKIDAAFEKIDKLKANAEKNLANAKELFQSALDEAMRPKKGWVEKRLGEVYDVRDGTHDSPKYVAEGWPLVTSKNLRYGRIVLDDVKHISKSDYDAINARSKVDVGDVLMAMIGTIGNPVVVTEPPEYAIKNIALFKLREGQLSQFLRYQLLSTRVAAKMANEASGSNQHFVGLKYLRNFIADFPPLDEQRQIVSRLDVLSQKIEALQQNYARQVADCAEMRQAILREAFEGRLCTREKGKWHLPEDWEAQDKALDAEIAKDFYAD